MNDFAIFEYPHTLAHLWERYKSDYEETGVSFADYVFAQEPEKAYRLMLIFKYIQSLEE